MNTQATQVHELASDPANVRTHDDRNIEAIANSLKRFGQQKPIVVDSSGVVRAGNGTLEAAKRLGWETIQTVTTDLEGSEATAYAIADNRTAELADWSEDLAQQLASIAADDEELARMTGFSDEEISEMVSRAEPQELNEDEVPEAPDEPITKTGDLILLGDHRLLCGDSINPQDVERLMDGKKADMVFTDPPYGVEYRSNMSQRFEQIKNDDTILEVAPIIWQFLADDSAAFVWTSHHVYPTWRKQFDAYYKQTIIWAKGGGGMGDLQGQYALDYEMALFCVKGSPKFQGKRGVAVWNIGKDAASEYVHPTQKPVALAEQALVDFTKTRQITLDLFGGSGSTLIACERQHRHARLMELDPAYCDVIVQRWENFTGKKAERLTNG